MKLARMIILGLVVVGAACSTQAATRHTKTVAITATACSSTCKSAPRVAGVGVRTVRVVPRPQPRRVVIARRKPRPMRVISLVAPP